MCSRIVSLPGGAATQRRVFCLDFLFYVGFVRVFMPLACVFGGYFYYSLAAEPAA